MKKQLYLLILLFVGSLVFVSCEKDEEFFDETLLPGTWVSGTEYYKYMSNGTGSTWDTSDDVSEEEAQEFTWELVGSEFTHIHILEIGGTVPKVYTMLELTTNTLRYEDSFGKQFSYNKVN